MNFRNFIVYKIIQESSTIRSFYLKPQDNGELDKYLPGQFITLQIYSEDSKKTIYRSYSLSDHPENDYYRISVKKESNGFISKFLHEEVEQNHILKVSRPTGKFYLNNEKTVPVVMLSGGVGITPMLSMLEHLIYANSKSSIFFIHSSKNKDVQPMAKRLSEIKRSYSNILINIHHSNPLSNEKQGIDFDNKGKISIDYLKKTLEQPSHCIYYLCGPQAFMQEMYNYLILLEVDESKIHYEFFGNAQKLGATTINNKVKKGFRINFAKTNKLAGWNENYNSILELAESVDIFPDNECRMGTCLTCETKLYNGKVKYDPEPFMEAQEGRILICCSQPETDLTIDL